MADIILLINPEIMKLDREYKLLSKELTAAEMLVSLKYAWANMPDGTKYEKALFDCILKAETDVLLFRKQLKSVQERMFAIMNRMQAHEI